jgi:hypothetical protein
MLQGQMMKPTLILATIIYLVVFLPAVIVAPMATFLYNDPDAVSFILNIFAILWFMLPVTLLISTLGAWFTFVRKKNKLSGSFLLLPIFHSALFAIFGILHFAR